MKLIHVSDLHIGKSIYGLSLLESGDQRFWIEGFLELVKKEEPQAVLIAGDVYDRSNPPKEAIDEVDWLLSSLTQLACRPAVLMIAGNHDSGALVGYLKGIAAAQKIYTVGTVQEKIQKVTLEDEYGPVDLWPVPYVFPAAVNHCLGTDLRSYDDAFRAYLAQQDIDFGRRNVILAHQNITSEGKEAERGGSETMVGGVGGIDSSVFDGFEYAALGHIHAAQQAGRRAVRYAGSPLCYHFDETKHPKKGPVVVTLGEKGSEPEIRVEEIRPLHPMREVRGRLEEIEKAESGSLRRNEYIRAVLVPDAGGTAGFRANTEDRLRALFRANGSLLLDIAYEYAGRDLSDLQGTSQTAYQDRPLEELFTEFWSQRREQPMDRQQLQALRLIVDQSENADRRIPADPEKLSAKEQADIDAIVKLVKEQAEAGADRQTAKEQGE